ncbi:hypothetical protein LPU83_pLPU83c_0176 (plasmid) [Rhizobium favelukesii]|uniref:Uncharacterized protein n=1 Tax=Rhizobium favelukesii TaxID=348824 RepID=W6RPF7_9HYPH|nr:hypothetical protein LPU83_pLPU83c_0176 [Rhizobium favelukesii]
MLSLWYPKAPSAAAIILGLLASAPFTACSLTNRSLR